MEEADGQAGRHYTDGYTYIRSVKEGTRQTGSLQAQKDPKSSCRSRVSIFHEAFRQGAADMVEMFGLFKDDEQQENSDDDKCVGA